MINKTLLASYLVFFGLVSSLVKSQNSEKKINENKFSIGLHYPGIVNTSGFFSANYKGIVGFDSQYSFFSNDNINLNAGISLDYLKEKENFLFKDLLVFNPNVGLEFKLINSGFKPFLNLGYGFFSSKTEFKSLNIYNPSDTFFLADFTEKFNGITINPGLKYSITSTFFLNVNYKFFKFNSKGGLNNLVFGFVNIGAGITL